MVVLCEGNSHVYWLRRDPCSVGQPKHYQSALVSHSSFVLPLSFLCPLVSSGSVKRRESDAPSSVCCLVAQCCSQVVVAGPKQCGCQSGTLLYPLSRPVRMNLV